MNRTSFALNTRTEEFPIINVDKLCSMRNNLIISYILRTNRHFDLDENNFVNIYWENV